jgi:hypothetical protein
MVTNPDGQYGTLVDGFTVLPHAPTVLDIIPNSSENSGVVNVTLLGINFAPKATVRLEMTGQTPINATNVNVNSATNITCSFDLASVSTGNWTLSVTNPGNQNSLLSGNNIFQFIVLLAKGNPQPNPPPAPASSYVGSVGVSSSYSAAQYNPAPVSKATSAAVPAGTVTLSADSNGLVMQDTSLQSVDTLALVSIPRGIAARDAKGSTLTSVIIAPLAQADVPADTPESPYSFTGQAYDLGPDDATFSPEITLTFTPREVKAGQAYTIRMRDHATSSWVDLATTYDPESGKVSAKVTHFCCFALFTQPVIPQETAGAAFIPTVQPTRAVTPPPPTAISIFSGVILFAVNRAMQYPLLVAGIVILVAGIAWFGRRKLRGRRKIPRERVP